MSRVKHGWLLAAAVLSVASASRADQAPTLRAWLATESDSSRETRAAAQAAAPPREQR